MKTTMTIRNLFVTLVATLTVLALAGCGASKPASASFASVVIENRTFKEIQNAAGEVFSEDGYTVQVRGNQMKFEKEGSRAKQLAYEGFTGGPVNIRVLASIVQISESSHRFQCQAYIVKSPGDPTFEEVIKLQNVRSGPYQDLCDKIAKKLK
ncbi:MAG TPA: hypothetical protein VFZ59_26025 [Verrucomicrobiae bacterium]|nr:hypothetical protein [Verrucomicrobiae bacterium]